jgi:hypothetical protein
VYWTRPRIVHALRKYAAANPGLLPSSDNEWNRLKKGRLDLPTAGAVLSTWGSMRRAWLAIGAESSRVVALNARWSKTEKAYLLENAGTLTLTRIAKNLNRTYESVKTMIGSKGMGITARANNGYWSAAQLAKEYGCPYNRIQQLLEAGAIPAFRHPRRQSWQIDPADLSPGLIAELRKEKQTHKETPTDLGDYRQRYGLRRLSIKAVRQSAHLAPAPGLGAVGQEGL